MIQIKFTNASLELDNHKCITFYLLHKHNSTCPKYGQAYPSAEMLPSPGLKELLNHTVTLLLIFSSYLSICCTPDFSFFNFVSICFAVLWMSLFRSRRPLIEEYKSLFVVMGSADVFASLKASISALVSS